MVAQIVWEGRDEQSPQTACCIRRRLAREVAGVFRPTTTVEWSVNLEGVPQVERQ
jgi:hypothetical protein